MSMGRAKTNLKLAPVAVEWRVMRIAGPKARMLGTVIAADAETALEMALAEFGIAAGEKRRIVVQQTEAG
jgi:hypothetical protein